MMDKETDAGDDGEMEARMAAVDMWRLGVWQMIDGGSVTDRCIPAETVTR